mgnify:CR=1 FL=1
MQMCVYVMSTPSKNPEPKESSMKKRILSLALTLCLLAGLRRGGQPGGCRAVCGRGVYAEFRREDGHGPLYLPGAGLYRSVLPRVLGQLCGLCQPRVLHGVHLHGAVVPRHRRHARRARRLLAQRRPLRCALCHDAGGCCLQRRDVQQDLARRGHRARAATARRSSTSTAIRPTATMS